MQAQLVTSTLDEETARAEVYGLLAALFYAAPSAALYDSLRVAVTEAPAAGGLLESPWGELVAAARERSLADTCKEYDALFGGVGKPPLLRLLSVSRRKVLTCWNSRKTTFGSLGVCSSPVR